MINSFPVTFLADAWEKILEDERWWKFEKLENFRIVKLIPFVLFFFFFLGEVWEKILEDERWEFVNFRIDELVKISDYILINPFSSLFLGENFGRWTMEIRKFPKNWKIFKSAKNSWKMDENLWIWKIGRILIS